MSLREKMANYTIGMPQLTGVREFHVYLAATPFVVYTDHISLKYLESLEVSAHNRLARWALALQPYKFTVEHVGGYQIDSGRRFKPPSF